MLSSDRQTYYDRGTVTVGHFDFLSSIRRSILNTHQTYSIQRTQSDTMGAVLLGLFVGAFVILGVGFTHSDTIHNAAHDTRHSTAFPCH